MNEAAWEREIAKPDEIIRRQADEIAALTKQAASLQQEVSELKSLLQEKASTKDTKKPRIAEDYSLNRQARKKTRRRKKKSIFAAWRETGTGLTRLPYALRG